MNRIVQVFPLRPEQYQQVQLPEGYKILTTNMINGALFLWALIPSASVIAGFPHDGVGIYIIPDTKDVPDDAGDYIGSFMLQNENGLLVMHVFKQISRHSVAANDA